MNSRITPYAHLLVWWSSSFVTVSTRDRAHDISSTIILQPLVSRCQPKGAADPLSCICDVGIESIADNDSELHLTSLPSLLVTKSSVPQHSQRGGYPQRPFAVGRERMKIGMNTGGQIHGTFDVRTGDLGEPAEEMKECGWEPVVSG